MTTIATSPLSEPRVYLPYSYYDPGRSKTAEWVVAIDENGTEKIASLDLYHHKDRKAFIVRLGREHKQHSIGSDGKSYSVTTKVYGIGRVEGFSDVTILNKPVARYSEKARDAAFQEALDKLRDYADTPDVTKFFENEGFEGVH